MTVYDNSGNARRGSAGYVNAIPPKASDGHFVSGPVAFGWTGLSGYSDRLAALIQKIETQRVEGAQRLANDMREYAQANAPWQDRTGQARETLMTTVVDYPELGQTDVILGYGVFYGKFLEDGTQHAKSYAIVRPTVAYFREHLMEYLS